MTDVDVMTWESEGGLIVDPGASGEATGVSRVWVVSHSYHDDLPGGPDAVFTDKDRAAAFAKESMGRAIADGEAMISFAVNGFVLDDPAAGMEWAPPLLSDV